MKIKNFLNKWKKQNFFLKTLFLLLLIWYFISLLFFTRSMMSLTGIETTIRVIILLVLFLHLFIYGLYGLVLLFTKKKRIWVLFLLTLIYSPILNIASYYIDRTYNIIDGVQKKYVEYTSVMLSLKDSTKYDKIGIITSEEDPTGYIIPKEMIKSENIKGTLVDYDDYISMITDMYDGKIDAMFVADSYATMFSSYEKFANIEADTKVVHSMTKKLENVDNVSYSTKKLDSPFTILLMGVDSTGDGITSGASFNGDSLMMITFNPHTLNATVFSIPRDTYVPIACNQNRENKINSSAYGGTSCVVKTVENLTGIKIDYYMKINFTGVVNLVDDLGGVTVDVPIKFCEQDSQRRFGEYLICLDKGVQKLNGEQALAFARHRHSLPLGDFQRVQHQQMVVEAMIKEIKNIKSIEDFYKILEDVANNIDTNLSTPQILSLYGVGKDILLNSLKNDLNLSIQKTYLTGYDLTMYIPSYRSNVYTFQYYKQSLEDIVEAMKVNLELSKPKVIKTFSFDFNEEYSPQVVGKTYYNEPRRELMPSFIGKTKIDVENWLMTREIEVEYLEESSPNPTGQIIKQSFVPGTLVEAINKFTITISKYDGSNPSTDPNTPEEPNSDLLPDFVGKKLTDFNKWKNTLKNANFTIDTKELSVDDIASLGLSDLEEDTIYKQSVPKGTNLEEISSLIVYYYKKVE
ncbi:MAG TPA: hypothetical protein DCY94_04010 [Firmicutes bacterium]|nr:hypothetical protein [Bacillota bacterium]